ncbi:MAG: AraC family transcriptional regulator [Rubrivivax sp.]
MPLEPRGAAAQPPYRRTTFGILSAERPILSTIRPMSDRLTALLHRFELRAQVLESGSSSGASAFPSQAGSGHLHLLRSGGMDVHCEGRLALQVDQPSVLLIARPLSHRLVAPLDAPADRVSTRIDFGAGDENPLLLSLPPVLVVALADAPGLDMTQQLLFGEAFGGRCGHDAAVDRLTEVLVIQVLRHAIERRLTPRGVLTGLSDTRLARVLNAVHAQPAQPWTLARMAQQAGMSRSRFAAQFTHAVGSPPGDYVTQWRLGLARSLLRRGVPVKAVAAEVGYASTGALSRAFTQRLGLPPTAWLAREALAA